MKNAKKWRHNLQSIDFPYYDKMSDKEIMALIYDDGPERLALLKWLAYKIGEENPLLFNMSQDDIVHFISDRGLLSSHQANDFIQAQCSKKQKEDFWKILFSFSRMQKFLRPAVEDRTGIRSQFAELVKGHCEGWCLERQPSIEIEEIVSNSHLEKISESCLLEREPSIEIEEVASNSHLETILEGCRLERQPTTEFEEIVSNSQPETILKDIFLPFNINRSVEEIKTLNQSYNNLHISNKNLNVKERVKAKEAMPKNEWFKESEAIPRIYVMPGSPPLGQLDTSQLTIKIEDSAPPISVDGSPSKDHGEWQCRIFQLERL